MQRSTSSRRSDGQRDALISHSQHRDAPRTVGNSVSPGLVLAPPFVQSLPSLEGQPTSYSHEVHGELLYELCAAFARSGLGTPETWRKCHQDSLTFAQYVIINRIGAERGDLLQRNVEYRLQISDVIGPDDNGLSTGQLAISICCSGCGYLRIGPALRALEAEKEGLGAAFYWTLIHSLYRVMRIYDHSDAQMYEENLIEYAEQDDEANHEQFEFPEVEKALPECIRRTANHVQEDWRTKNRQLLKRHSQGRLRSWIEHVLAIERLARVKARSRESPDLEQYYDGPPLPSLLVVFEDRDAISACFDEEGQHMLEGPSEPTFCHVFSPEKVDEFTCALRAVERFVAINYELFELVEELKKVGEAQ
jgi:hypothetical protein